LAQAHGLQIRKMLSRLKAAGLTPALDEKVFKARFYKRRDVGAEAYFSR
jgi:hypothetical protein